MKILLLSPDQINRYNWGHQLLRNEIGKHHDVFYYGNGYPNFDSKLTAPQIIEKYGPFDMLLTYGLRYTLPFKDIGNVKIKKAHVVIDLFPKHPAGYKGSLPKYKPFLDKNKYDILFYRQRCQSEYLKEIGSDIPSYWFPFSVDTNVYKKLNLPKKYDVLTSATLRSDVYPNRVKVNNIVKKMGLSAVTGRVVHQKYIEAINQTKICIISTNVFKSPNMKFTEFTSCGTFVLSDKPDNMEELGFKDGKHLVIYKDLKDLEDKINYYLKNEKKREKIAKQGMEFTRKNHNNVVRLKTMFEQINKEFGL
jgi:glycosyltransferase involved in cell wall biosynthesis